MKPLFRCIIYLVCIGNLTIKMSIVATTTRQDIQTLRGNIKLLLAAEQYDAAKQILSNDAQKGAKRILPISEYNQLMAQALTNIRKQSQATTEEKKQLLANYKIYNTTAPNAFKTAQLGEFSTKNIDAITQWFTKAYSTYQKDDTPAQTIIELKNNIITRIANEQNLAIKVEQLKKEKLSLTTKTFTALLNDTAAYTHRLAYLGILPKIITDIKSKHNIDFAPKGFDYQEAYIKKNAIKLITEQIKDLKQLQELFTDIKKFTTPERVQEVIEASKQKLVQTKQLLTNHQEKLKNLALIIPEKDLSKNPIEKLKPIGALLTEWHQHYKTNNFKELKIAITERVKAFTNKKRDAEDLNTIALKEQQREIESLQPIIDRWNGTKETLGAKANLYADQLTLQTYYQQQKAFNSINPYSQAKATPAINPTSKMFTFDPTERRNIFVIKQLNPAQFSEIAQKIEQ